MNHHQEMLAALEAMENTNEAMRNLAAAVGDLVQSYEATAVRMNTLLDDLKTKSGL